MLGNFFGPSGRLKTLLDRLTTARAANLDKLDANITTRAAASTALSNVTWSDAKAAFLDAAVTSRLALASIQYGTVTIASSSATGTATITSVDTAKTVLIFLGADTTASAARITLTNATTVTATRGTSPASSITVGFVAVEFD